MAISDEVALILKGQNVASPAIDEVVKSLRALRTILNSTTDAIDKYNIAAGKFAEISRAMIGPQNDLRYIMETTTRAVQAQAVAMRELGAAGVAATRGTKGAGTDTSTGSSSGGGRSGGGFGIGSMLTQGLVYGGGYLALSGIKSSVTQAIQFGATAASTQATTGISAVGLKYVTDGILAIASSGKSRYDANQLLAGAYAIISQGTTNPATILSQLQAAAASATAANAPDVLPSTNALTTVMNAYGMTGGAMKAQDVISMAINQGKADPTQVPGAFATFARSAKTAGVSAADAGGFFAFDTLASRDAQTSGQDMDAFFRLVNNPNRVSRTFAKSLPGLDWGTGMVQRAGGLDKFLQNVLAITAGPNRGLLLAHLFNNAPALAAVEGAAADPAKLSQYLKNASGVLPGGGSVTQKGADTFLGSPEGKLFSATNELKTQFQKFSDSAIPLMTTAVGALTTGIGVLLGPGGHGGIGASALGAGVTIAEVLSGKNPFTGDAQRAAAQDMGLSGGGALAHGVVPGSPEWQRLPQWAKDAYLHPSVAAQEVSRIGPRGLQTMQTIPAHLLEGMQQSASAPMYFAPPGYGPSAVSPSLGAGSGDVPGISPTITANQARAVQLAKSTGSQRKTGDMTSAQATFNLAMATNQSLSTVHAAEQDYEAAIRDSGMDPATIAWTRQQARATEASYRQSLATTAAQAASALTQTGYAHVQAVLSNAQFSGVGIGAAQQGEIRFLRANPTLWGGDPAILQSMINSVTGAGGASAALPKAITERLLRPTLPSDALTANFGASAARLTGGPDQAGNATIRELQKQVAMLREEISELKGVNKNTKKAADVGEVAARGILNLVAQGSQPAARGGANFQGRRR